MVLCALLRREKRRTPSFLPQEWVSESASRVGVRECPIRECPITGYWHPAPSAADWPKCVPRWPCRRPILAPSNRRRRSCNGWPGRTSRSARCADTDVCVRWRCYPHSSVCPTRICRRTPSGPRVSGHPPPGHQRRARDNPPFGSTSHRPCAANAVPPNCGRSSAMGDASANRAAKNTPCTRYRWDQCAWPLPPNGRAAPERSRTRRNQAYNPQSDHFAGGLVQRGLSVAPRAAPQMLLRWRDR